MFSNSVEMKCFVIVVRGRVYTVINVTVTAGDCYKKNLIKKVNIL